MTFFAFAKSPLTAEVSGCDRTARQENGKFALTLLDFELSAGFELV